MQVDASPSNSAIHRLQGESASQADMSSPCHDHDSLAIAGHQPEIMQDFLLIVAVSGPSLFLQAQQKNKKECESVSEQTLCSAQHVSLACRLYFAVSSFTFSAGARMFLLRGTLPAW